MTSSTSSSSTITKTLLVFAGLFGAYSGYLGLTKPEVQVYQNQWIRNYARAQEYIYSDKDFDAVIVGTSLSARLPKDKLDGGVYNLTFEGGSALTGLDILATAGRYPKVILIESNLVDAPGDERMVDTLFTPLEWRLKRYAKAMQDKYQPINLMLSAWFPEKPRLKLKKLSQGPDPAVFQKNLEMQAKALNDNPPGFYAAGLDELKKATDFFRSKNVRILFFRMPVDPKLVGSLKYVAMDRELRRRFPEIAWLPQPEDAKYETEDGSHLTYRAAQWFTGDFNRWIGDLFGRAAAVAEEPKT